MKKNVIILFHWGLHNNTPKTFFKALFLNILFKKNIKFRAKKQSEYGEFSKLFAKL